MSKLHSKRGKSMKKIKKAWTLCWLMVLMCILPVMQAAAEEGVPADVKKVSVSAVTETSAKLSWGKVSKADGYMVYSVDETSGQLKKVKSTAAQSYTVNKLKPGEKYTYQVFSYNKENGKTILSTNGKQVSFKTKLVKPAKPTGLTLSLYSDGAATLKWNSAQNATGYYLYKYDTATKTYEKYKSTKEKTIKISGLKDGTEYKFKLTSYRKVNGKIVESAFSNVLTVEGKEFSKDVKAVHGRRFKATLKTATTVTITKTKEKVKLKKGQSITTTSKTAGNATAYLSDGRSFKISGKKLNYGNLSLSKSNYSEKVKEAFVNSRGYSSPTKYLIWISQYTANVTIFKGEKYNWEVVRSMKCVVGRQGKTPQGVFRLDPNGKGRDYAYGGIRVYFTWNRLKEWGNSFHMRTSGTQRGAESSGCIRLGSSDLNYLASHCGSGTTVVSY